MADRTVLADERALRLELQELTNKREALNSSKRRGSATPNGRVVGRRSVFDRLGGEPKARSGGTDRHIHPKESNSWGNPSRRRGKRDNEENRQTSVLKKQKLHSAVTRPDGSHDIKEMDSNGTSSSIVSPSASSAHAQERKLRAVAPYAQKDGIARSKRMFGALMGHLGKAKRQIEKDTSLFKRQDTKQQEAEQKEKMQSQYLENQARFEAEVDRLEASIARTELDRSEEIARAKLEHLQTIRKGESQSKFLLTITSPPIYYLPAKHSEETKELVAASMEAHEAKTKASGQTHEETVRKTEAEYASKLETLRDQLEIIKKKKTANEQAANTKKEDKLNDDNEDMSDGSKPVAEKDESVGQQHGDNMSEGSNHELQIEAEDLKLVRQSSVSDKAPDGNCSRTRREDNGKDDNEKSSDRKEEIQTMNDHSRAQSDSSNSNSHRGKQVEKAVDQKEGMNESSQKCDEVANKVQSERIEHPDADVVLNNTTEIESPGVSSDKSTAYVAKMKVAELRSELRKRGLDPKGLKVTLVERLQQAISEDK
ncbi:SAP domain [Plasmopara halstedii]|uniref:SAP domain n=1 Tax=Plasmopara halstedii TaxID=4781 RepID=A0A0N7L3W4_PLAHL|nr:SAP domain [Plasmopara halstedii]CEG37003.1 SAP domain [Plasmopara halstedii]|eukprot:XP_024573372.1 SAP domain [Plasmopara halstedii]